MKRSLQLCIRRGIDRPVPDSRRISAAPAASAQLLMHVKSHRNHDAGEAASHGSYEEAPVSAYSTFFRKEQPSVKRAIPPVGWQSIALQLPQRTTVCAWL